MPMVKGAGLGSSDMVSFALYAVPGGWAAGLLPTESVLGAFKDVTIDTGKVPLEFSVDKFPSVASLGSPYAGGQLKLGVGFGILSTGEIALESDEVFNTSGVTYDKATSASKTAQRHEKLGLKPEKANTVFIGVFVGGAGPDPTASPSTVSPGPGPAVRRQRSPDGFRRQDPGAESGIRQRGPVQGHVLSRPLTKASKTTVRLEVGMQVQGRVHVADGRSADGVVLMFYRRGFGGAATNLGATTVERGGSYSFSFESRTTPVHLEIRAAGADGRSEFSLLETTVEEGGRAGEVELNLVLPAAARPLEFGVSTPGRGPHPALGGWPAGRGTGANRTPRPEPAQPVQPVGREVHRGRRLGGNALRDHRD